MLKFYFLSKSFFHNTSNYLIQLLLTTKKIIMKLLKHFGKLIMVFLLLFTLTAGDHIDPPTFESSANLLDLFAFEGEKADNTTFIITSRGFLAPGRDTRTAKFDRRSIIEFNIDNTGDFVEDLIIQAIRIRGRMYFYGPYAPSKTGNNRVRINTKKFSGSVKISKEFNERLFTNKKGVTFFAGPRRDPFFADFDQVSLALSGQDPNGFSAPEDSSDLFDSLNVLSIAIDVPNKLLGEAPEHIATTQGIMELPPAYNVWVTSKLIAY